MAAKTKTKPSKTSKLPIKRRTQVERSATTRRHLLDAAIECLSKFGYLQSTVEVVAERAGVSRGAVQHHFGSRDELLLAVVEDLGDALAVAEEISPALPVSERLAVAIDRDWDVFRSSQFIAVIQIWLAVRGNKELFASISKTVGNLEKALDRRWQSLFAETRISPKKISTIRHLVLSTLRGLALRNIFRQEQSAWTEEIALLKTLIAETLDP